MDAPLASSGRGMIKNAMTIDVEDYFQVSAFAPTIPRNQWDNLPCRVERNVMRILDLLDTHSAKATFFTLGWVAERYPQLVREIVGRGHELASHGYGHLRATDQTETDFRTDVTHAKKLLEDLSGVAVTGYRAPSFSIGARNLWAFDVLNDAGYQYSSSVYPIKHDHYGMPEAPRFAFKPSHHDLLELPATTLNMMGRNLPASGGGYFRLLPYSVSAWMMRRVNEQDGKACIFYFHPWEIDPDQPRQRGIGMKTRFRHYVNLSRMEGRIAHLLKDFQWDRMDRIFLNQPV